MKTLTVTISDEAAQKLADHAAQNGQSSEQWAARVVEEAVETDWFDDLDEEAQSAVLQGVAEADRAEFATDAEVEEAFSRFKR